MKSFRLLGLAATVLLADSSGWLVSGPRGDAADVTPTPGALFDRPRIAMTETGAKRPSAISLPKPNLEVAASATSRAPEWRKLLQESDDYWEFAESAIGPAKEGDGEARYWLALALNECRFVYSYYFFDTPQDAPPRRRSLEEARQRATHEPFLNADDMDLLEKRCSRLGQADDAPFGGGIDWLEEALAVDNPLAQASAANEKALTSRYGPDPEEARSEARWMIVDAVRTRDPAVLLLASETAANLAFDDEAEGKRRRLSWTLAACLRTPDCDDLALWRKYRCNWDSQCQPYETPRDIIRRDAGSDFDEVERRARELNEKIDAGTLDEADI